MDLRSLVAWLVLFVIAVLAPLASHAAEEWPKSTTAVVVDVHDKPVASATVRRLELGDSSPEANPPIVMTDSAGRFEFPRRKDNGYTVLWIEAPDGAIAHLPSYAVKGDAEPTRVVVQRAMEVKALVQNADRQPLSGARVVALASMVPIATGQTDEHGQLTLKLPASAANWSICAWQPKQGFDFASAAAEDPEAEVVTLTKPPAQLALTLTGAKTVRVQALDHLDKPLAGVSIGPWSLQKQDHTEINLSGTTSLWPRTDAQGLVTIDWLPAKFSPRMSLIHRSPGRYAADNALVVPAEARDAPLTLRLLPLEQLSGRVLRADGQPAAGATVLVVGQGVGHNSFHQALRTDAQGEFKLPVHSEHQYLLTATDKDQAALRSDIVVRIGKPVANIELKLAPAGKLTGQVTSGANKVPAANRQVMAYHDFGRISADLPRKAGDRTYHNLAYRAYATTDAAGNYELQLPPGEYKIQGPPQTQTATVIVRGGEAKLVQNFHQPRAEKAPLTVRVVNDKGEPVAGALVKGIYASSESRSWFKESQTSAQGELKTERSPDKLVLYAVGSDGKLAGIVTSRADDAAAEIKLAPLTAASGKLLNQQGAPIAGREVTYGIRIYMGEDINSAFTDAFGGASKTNDQGEFSLAGLIPGQKFQVNIKIDEHSSRTVTVAHPQDAQPLALGELRADPDPIKPYVPPTPVDRAAKAFATKADMPLEQRLKDLLAEAKREYTRPLLVLGTATDPACVALFRAFEQNDAKAKSAAGPTPQELRWEFEIAALDTSRKDLPAFTDSQKLSTAAPLLAVLDHDGNVTDSYSLKLTDERLDSVALGAWLAKHKLPTRDAAELLRAALAKAEQEDKRVWLTLSASWCGPCRMLSRFLAPFKPELEKHFIFVKLDISRDQHADTVREKYKESAQGGVPWFCIVDAKGKVLATSNMPKSPDERRHNDNIGFPSEPAAITHFLQMISTTAPRLPKSAQAEMEQALRKQ